MPTEHQYLVSPSQNAVCLSHTVCCARVELDSCERWRTDVLAEPGLMGRLCGCCETSSEKRPARCHNGDRQVRGEALTRSSLQQPCVDELL